MAQITGSTGSLPSHYAYWIDWVEDNVDTVNNTSRVTATVYVQKVGSYSVEGSQNSHTLYIDGTPFTANPYIDMNPETTPRVLVSGQKTITHNSDGSKSINISSSGQITYIPGAYYSPQSGSASATVGLTNIPREASITNSVNYTIGNSVPLTFSNPGGMYMKVRAYVWDGTDWEPYIKDQNMGNGTSGTYTFDSGDLADIYTQLGNNLQASCKFRVYSYTGSDYSSGYVGYKDKDGTAYINQTTNKPTFTDFDVANYDKSIAVKDKYDNTLTTSSTSTLLGSNDKVIKGHSKLRSTVAVADKMIPKNGATGIKYRFATPTQYAEGAYSAVADVNTDLDNVITKDVSVTAYDSRGLTTTVNKSLSYLAEYVPVSLWGLTLARDNGVDSETKLQISGSFWKQYFGGGTSGVQNSVTAHWRYKPTGDSWASQTWNSITLTDDGSGNLSYDDYINGDLGASGFDTEASFDIEVRIYDKLTATIVEQTLSVGTPVIDITKDGVSFGARYDSDEGGPIQEKGVRVNPVGVIQMYANATVPSGWLECNGQAISRTDYADLFDLIGTTYGSGNGTTTFNVPDLQGRVPVGFKSSDSSFDSMGETGGAKEHVLTTSQMPSHRHNFENAGRVLYWDSGLPAYGGLTSGSTVQYTWATTTQYVGGGQAHNNLQPYITFKFIIKY